MLSSMLGTMAFIWPVFFFPIIIGPYILIHYRSDDFSKLAGAFTLKPLIATPLWALALELWGPLPGVSAHRASEALTLAPGIGLTALILLVFRHALKGASSDIYPLLIVDALRWLNTFLLILIDGIGCLFLVLAYAPPTLYATMAVLILQRREMRAQQPPTVPVV